MAAQKEAAMGSGDERRLREVVTEVAAQAGYDLEELAIRSAGRRSVVRVVIDADTGVSLDAAAEVSRAISQRLDDSGAEDPAGSAPYTLEVTSPGIGRPLTAPRHFRRARTRLVSLVTADGRTVTGHVFGVTDDAVQLVLSGRKGVSQVEVPFADIARAKVEVEFSPPPAAVLAVLGVESTVEGEDDFDEEFEGELEGEGALEDEDEGELEGEREFEDESASPAGDAETEAISTGEVAG
jgi:ribosome maturation factor RimP